MNPAATATAKITPKELLPPTKLSRTKPARVQKTTANIVMPVAPFTFSSDR
jgi:hypothetical protein